MYLTEDGLNLANQILCSKIKLSSDSIIVLNIFGKILEGKTTTFRKRFDWTDKKSARFAS